MEFLVVLKRDCETCQLVEPVLAELRGEFPLTLYSQDDPTFPKGLGGALDDTSLEKIMAVRRRHRADIGADRKWPGNFADTRVGLR